MNTQTESVNEYQCCECKQVIEVRAKEIVRCPHCGYRILYKVRCAKWSQYESR
ncbi:DNA-directed RNA polymerases I, II, and III subunit RPABC4 [Nematocida sp. AWRm80]|nr:DNA-directed RNA polymerases I, II, and III subunit RPABC4 [Nematocida sp. AWRm80]